MKWTFVPKNGLCRKPIITMVFDPQGIYDHLTIKSNKGSPPVGLFTGKKAPRNLHLLVCAPYWIQVDIHMKYI